MDSPIVISIRAKNLRQLGFKNLLHWLEKSNHIYIGRNMTHYVPGAVGSKWKNPFSVKEFGRGGCIKKYEKYTLDHNIVYNSNLSGAFANVRCYRKNKKKRCYCHRSKF